MKLYDTSLKYFEEVLAYKDLQEQEDKNQAEIAICTSQMAGCLRELKRYDDAIKILEKSLQTLIQKYGENNLITANCQNNLGLTYKKSGKFSKAEVLYLKSLKTRELMLSKDHPDIIASKHNLAELYMETDDKEKAEEFLVETMEAIKRVEQSQQQQRSK
ncbi:hypothetical protein IMG5_097080 [Ichthyophthirius multifiliis]|uniref:Tetratricopeptide repeat protein n=1 Tax=Ichthyophthirius multifiliis TaxID=5932 RepID=G0QRR1_ICHMU|nr:hypothetical protein IMG5_097080 [Ichthyophthirius multifiliis]EGR32094.1 hypothetical protein IMG5_097080 [Ichthyophthirius multifiliis]|eukprot:XP_004035580.1 hypothetical protein IMG5_097080 [Ichthyophthirius multifiliis]